MFFLAAPTLTLITLTNPARIEQTSMLGAYERILARRPVLVKSATGLLLGASGDFTAQRLEGGAYDQHRERCPRTEAQGSRRLIS